MIYAAIEFPPNEADVPRIELTKVKAVGEVIRRLRHYAYEVEGHADPSEGSADLSRTRAENVLDLLRRYGVEPKRLLVVDKGSGPPPEGVERNSRVTFNVRQDLFPCE